MILAVAELVRSHRAVLSADALDALAKYQVMLDNEPIQGPEGPTGGSGIAREDHLRGHNKWLCFGKC